MDIEKLAEITATEFAQVHEQFQDVDKRFQGVEKRLDRLEAGQVRLESGIHRLETGLKGVLDVVLEIPTKKVITKLVHKVEDIDERVTVVEHKLRAVPSSN